MARFADKSYAPEAGRDCWRLFLHDMHLLGVPTGDARSATYATELGGIKAARKAGFNDLVEVVDSLGLVRIPPLSAMPADVVALPSGHPMGALAIAVGQGRLLAYLDGHNGAVVVEPKAFVCAWRAI